MRTCTCPGFRIATAWTARCTLSWVSWAVPTYVGSSFTGWSGLIQSFAGQRRLQALPLRGGRRHLLPTYPLPTDPLLAITQVGDAIFDSCKVSSSEAVMQSCRRRCSRSCPRLPRAPSSTGAPSRVASTACASPSPPTTLSFSSRRPWASCCSCFLALDVVFYSSAARHCQLCLKARGTVSLLVCDLISV